MGNIPVRLSTKTFFDYWVWLHLCVIMLGVTSGLTLYWDDSSSWNDTLLCNCTGGKHLKHWSWITNINSREGGWEAVILALAQFGGGRDWHVTRDTLPSFVTLWNVLWHYLMSTPDLIYSNCKRDILLQWELCRCGLYLVHIWKPIVLDNK